MSFDIIIRDPIFLVSANVSAAVLLRIVKPNLLSALILAVVMIASAAYLGTNQAREILSAIYTAQDYVLTATGKPTSWPPRKYRRYPDLQLTDQYGKTRRLSEFAGKVILVEPVGMSCPGCVAFSGGSRRGPFRGIAPQPGLASIDEYAQEYGGVNLEHPDIVVVQLLLFNQEFEVPTQEEVTAWAKHFGCMGSKNRVVFRGNGDLLNSASHALIPGFQLIDRNFVLRMDSTGDQPADDLYSQLLSAIPELLDEAKPNARY